jgi:hypothetical protein
MNNKGMGELLGLLKDHPELVDALVYDPKRVRRFLKTEAARRLIGTDTEVFLRYVSGSGEGASLALCLGGTKLLCAGATKVGLPCLHGTKPPTCLPGTIPPPCPSGTKPPSTRHPCKG